MSDNYVATRTDTAVLETNKVVKNTYMLLSMVLGVAAVGAAVSLAVGVRWSMGMWLLFMAVFIGGPFLINSYRNSVAGIGITFAWAGLTGFLFGPLIGAYLTLPGGSGIVFNALATTAVLFLGLSGYALTTRKDFSFMAGFLFAGLLVVLLAIVANIFFQIPALSLAISSVAVLLMCGLILFDTSRMIHDGQANYVMITVSLFANITVMFSHLMSLFSFFSGDD